MNSTPAQPQLYTAAQLAQALGISKQAVHKALQAVPSEVKPTDKCQTHRWPLSSLPRAWRERLESAASANRHRDVDTLLAGPAAVWQPEIPLADCADRAVAKAVRLRDAMATPLALRDDTSLSRADFEQIGLRDYRAVFGHGITGRQWWNLFNRTMERAQGRDDFLRLELYLDESPARKPQAAPLPEDDAHTDPFPEITRHIRLCRNPNELTESNARAIWLAALESYAGAVELGGTPRLVKEQVLDYLYRHAPALAATREALRKAFNRRFGRWEQTDGKPSVLRDLRVEANRKRGIALPQDDLDLLTIYAVKACGGRVSQAWRECLRDGLLSEQTAGRFLANPAVKSHVPATVRNAIKYDVPLLLDQARRPKHTRDNGAWIDRCWDSIPSLSWFCADDATLPVYFRVPDGRGWWTLMRGQFLVNICARSTAILSFALIPETNYNARAIRTLMTRTFDRHGLPRRGFYFENGIWKSKLLIGATGVDALGWDETEQGLKEFGLRFIHAKRARSKPVERVIGALQNYMEGDPGYSSRDERRDTNERFKREKQLLESRKIAPEKFYALDQWEARLVELCERYNAEPQQGKHTAGLSPEDALEMFRSQDDPPVIPDASWRYLVAHHKRPMRVTVNGITLPKSFGGGVYRNERTGELRGQTVLVWFNPEEPDIITVTDLDRRNPFCVERSQSVPAILEPDDAAGQELLAQELGRCEAHMSYTKTRYRVLNSKCTPQFRRNLVSPATARLGAEIEQQRETLLAEQQENSRRVAKARRIAGQIGMRPETIRRPEQLKAAERLAQLLNEDEPETTEASQ